MERRCVNVGNEPRFSNGSEWVGTRLFLFARGPSHANCHLYSCDRRFSEPTPPRHTRWTLHCTEQAPIQSPLCSRLAVRAAPASRRRHRTLTAFDILPASTRLAPRHDGCDARHSLTPIPRDHNDPYTGNSSTLLPNYRSLSARFRSSLSPCYEEVGC